MTFSPNSIGSNLASSPDYYRLPWATAPKPVLAAFEKAIAANEAHDEATINEQTAKIEAKAAQAKYDIDATESVRKTGKLPASDEKEISNYRLKAAEQDVHTALMAKHAAEGVLGGLLNEESTRDAWLAAMEKQLEADKKLLGEKATEVIELTNRIQQAASYSTFLVVWPHYGAPALDVNNYVSKTIDAALNTRLHQKPVAES